MNQQQFKLSSTFCITDRSSVQYVRTQLIPELKKWNEETVWINRLLTEGGSKPLCPIHSAKGRVAYRLAVARLKLAEKGARNG